MSPSNYEFNQGLVTSRDATKLAPGEMAVATGIYYKNGDKERAHKLPARSVFGDTGEGAKVKGLAICQFDAGADYVIAFAGTDLYGATPGVTGTFASIASAITGDYLDHAHANDRHYLATGSFLKVLESDGSVRDAGLRAPPAPPVLTTVVGGPATRANASSSASGWDDDANAYDGNVDTFSYGGLRAAGSATITYGFAANTGSTRALALQWSLSAGSDVRGNFPDRSGSVDTGAQASPDFNVNVKIESSENAGGAWTERMDGVFTTIQSLRTMSFNITDTIDLASNVLVRFTLTFNSGTSSAYLRVHDVRWHDTTAGGGADFSTTGDGLLYAYTEYDKDTGLESPPSPTTGRLTFSNRSGVNVDLPATAENDGATHYNIYRTTDGGIYQDMGLVAQVLVGDDYIDEFDWGLTEQPPETLKFLPIQGDSSGTPQLYPRDEPPPILRRIGFHEGTMWGLTEGNRRELRYAIAGRAESWPIINVITGFDFDDHDQIVDCESLGSVLIIGCKGLMIRLDEFPRSHSGAFIASGAERIKGADGVVGDYAMSSVPLEGESHEAWIAHSGIYVTNGFTFRSISEDFDWTAVESLDKSNWSLSWDEELRCLVFAQGSRGIYYLIHVDREHVKPTGQPKWTGPHYGDFTAYKQAQVGGRFRTYSAHYTDGKVYLERGAADGLDASNAYDTSGTNPLIITTGKEYARGWTELSVHGGRLRHTDFGAGETASIAHSHGRDASGHTSTKTSTVSLAGDRTHQFHTGRRGEWHQVTLTHTGAAEGALTDLVYRVQQYGQAGKRSA